MAALARRDESLSAGATKHLIAHSEEKVKQEIEMSAMKIKKRHKEVVTEAGMEPPLQSIDRSNGANSSKRVLQKFARALKPYEVEVSPSWRSCTLPGKISISESITHCYGFAWVFGLTNGATKDRLWLVDGECAMGLRHAWVELPGGIVFDGNLQQFYARDGYYDTLHARPLFKFTYGAMCTCVDLMTTDQNGRIPLKWNEILKLPRGNPDNPTMIDEKRAWQLVRTSGLMAWRWFWLSCTGMHGIWMSAAEWASYLERKGCNPKAWMSQCWPDCEHRHTKGWTRYVEKVLEAHAQETFGFCQMMEFVTMRLERSSPADSPRRYRFVELGRRKLDVTA